jgi:hypothetical protein
MTSKSKSGMVSKSAACRLGVEPQQNSVVGSKVSLLDVDSGNSYNSKISLL